MTMPGTQYLFEEELERLWMSLAISRQGSTRANRKNCVSGTIITHPLLVVSSI